MINNNERNPGGNVGFQGIANIARSLPCGVAKLSVQLEGGHGAGFPQPAGLPTHCGYPASLDHSLRSQGMISVANNTAQPNSRWCSGTHSGNLAAWAEPSVAGAVTTRWWTRKHPS
jgi:hypothetical protein